jgi:hypothetical protein
MEPEDTPEEEGRPKPVEAESQLCTHLKFLMQVYKKMRLSLVGEKAEICCTRCGISAEITQGDE